MINKTRWIVPVIAKQELEILLDASIGLCKQNLDAKSEHCQRFYRESLIISFTKILTDEAVKTWKPEIHVCYLPFLFFFLKLFSFFFFTLRNVFITIH